MPIGIQEIKYFKMNWTQFTLSCLEDIKLHQRSVVFHTYTSNFEILFVDNTKYKVVYV